LQAPVDVQVIEAKTKKTKSLTSLGIGTRDSVGSVAVSPDGKRIAYAVWGLKPGERVSTRVYVADVDGTNSKEIYKSTPGSTQMTLLWQ
jgi:Tol biopolymer transport system component